jgi:hypothetical protein
VLAKDKKFLLLINHPWLYSYSYKSPVIGFGDELSDLLSRMVVTSFIVGSLTNYKINAVF